MRAVDCEMSKKLRHKVTKEIFELDVIDGEIMWVNPSGDTFSSIDEDLFDDLDYCS